MTDGFTLVTDKLPPTFLLVIVRDKNGHTEHGWYTGTTWDFSTRSVVPHSWKKYQHRIKLGK